MIGKAAMIGLAGGLGYTSGDASLTGPCRNTDYWTCGSSEWRETADCCGTRSRADSAVPGSRSALQFIGRALTDGAAIAAANLFQATTDWHTSVRRWRTPRPRRTRPWQ